MSKQSFYSSKKSLDPMHQVPSKVLLVCVYDTIVFEINNEMIKPKFDHFGSINKLLIFQKGEVTKLFVQYDTEEAAAQAKNALNGKKLFESICKMSIYFSNLDCVDLKHPTSEGQAYQSSEDESCSNHLSSYSPQKDSIKQNEQQWSLDGEDPLMKVFSPLKSFSRSKTDNPKTLQKEIKLFSNTQLIQEQVQIDQKIKKSIDTILGTDTQFSTETQNESPVKVKDSLSLQTSILFFQCQYHIPIYCVYNLFSNFGNISCIIAKKNHIFVRYRTKEFAAIASRYLNEKVFFQNSILLNKCNESSPLWQPNEGEFCQCTYFDPSFDRFTPQRSITINPPSSTLHLSSMKKEMCKEYFLRKEFEKYGNVQKVHILKRSNEKNMALVKFEYIEDSFSAIAYLHNQVFFDRKLQISFTKSKI